MSLYHREPGSEAAEKFDKLDVFWDTLGDIRFRLFRCSNTRDAQPFRQICIPKYICGHLGFSYAYAEFSLSTTIFSQILSNKFYRVQEPTVGSYLTIERKISPVEKYAQCCTTRKGNF